MSAQAPVHAVAAVTWRAGAHSELVPVEIIGPVADEIHVDIEAVGICHADIAAASGDFPVAFPIVLGHEGVGLVRSVGSDVSELVAGDRVVLSYDSCGHCAKCGSGQPTQCTAYMALNFPTRHSAHRSMTASGRRVQGGFFGQSSLSTVAVASARNAVRVDTALPASSLAPLGCGIQTGYGAVLNVARPEPSDTVVVIGLGAVGLAAVLAAASCGVRSLVVMDPVQARRELALDLGATTALDPAEGNWVAELDRQGIAVDIAIECSGHPSALVAAVASLRTGGTAVVVGAPPFGRTTPLDVASIVNKSIVIRGTVEGDSRPQEMVPFLVNEIESGRLPIDRLVTEFAFDDLRDALDESGTGGLVKPVVLMPGSARMSP